MSIRWFENKVIRYKFGAGSGRGNAWWRKKGKYFVDDPSFIQKHGERCMDYLSGRCVCGHEWRVRR